LPPGNPASRTGIIPVLVKAAGNHKSLSNSDLGIIFQKIFLENKNKALSIPILTLEKVKG
jgi:hypothetical protein